jgi:hypothetical protein
MSSEASWKGMASMSWETILTTLFMRDVSPGGSRGSLKNGGSLRKSCKKIDAAAADAPRCCLS